MAMENDHKPTESQWPQKTTPIKRPPSDQPEATARRLAQATQILQHLKPQVPTAEADVRTIDFLRAADEIVRPFGFEIVRLIGKGGMGAVFEGRDRKLDRAVAIKFILPERLEWFEGMAALLESEARALASINHENAVQIYAIHRQGDNLFIVMEMVRGTSLAAHVANRGPLPEAQTLRIMVQAARALAALHDQGIIHRDIKPENILLSDQGQAKLSDFGLAFAPEGAAPGILSSAAGTPAYMSPEVFEGEKPSVRSDIYSLGMTLRFMLTGKLADLGDSYDKIRHTVTRGQLPGLRTERPDVSSETELLVAMALKRSVDRRYQTAAALAAACEKALLTLGAVREKPETPPARMLLQSSARTLAFLFLLLLVGGVGGWWARALMLRGGSVFNRFLDTTSRSVIDTFVETPGFDIVPAEVATASPDGTKVKIIGVVSGHRLLDPKRNQFIVQDETGGVLIDDPNELGQIYANLQVGDKVAVPGIVRVWKGLRVVETARYAERTAHGRPPKEVPLTLEQIGPKWNGCRVLVTGLRWAEQQPRYWQSFSAKSRPTANPARSPSSSSSPSKSAQPHQPVPLRRVSLGHVPPSRSRV
ncbi:hypothetical protein AMJ85_11045 [candidate division BRC1 bacterium SM23_51]|nr:MAG: hypothetical protein AMJ85_11045 [candidate division BRC1 bacterium SM23_51]